MGATVAQSLEYSALDQRTRVRRSPGKKPTCTQMEPGACKIRRGCNILQVPMQNYAVGKKSIRALEIFRVQKLILNATS